ncbi:Hypothetical protein FKW44_016686, partial [Caligus rogercresseyi]
EKAREIWVDIGDPMMKKASPSWQATGGSSGLERGSIYKWSKNVSSSKDAVPKIPAT